MIDWLLSVQYSTSMSQVVVEAAVAILEEQKWNEHQLVSILDYLFIQFSDKIWTTA